MSSGFIQEIIVGVKARSIGGISDIHWRLSGRYGGGWGVLTPV